VSGFRFRHGAASVDALTRLVGNTPLVRIRKLVAHLPADIEVHAKLEFFNPGGSVKDRAALQMVKEALAQGKLGPEQTLVDSTSGNTGVAYAWIGAALGLRVCLVMPSNVSHARKQVIRALGAQLIHSDPMEGSDGAIRHVRRLVEEAPSRWFFPDQYSNPANPRAHALGTAEEIWAQTQGRVTHFVAGIGTSGTVMGTGRGLKGRRPGVQVLAVEPEEAMHGLEGLKHMASSIVPAIYEEAALDGKLSVASDAGWDMAERLARAEGLAVGHSSGAAFLGALQVAEGLAARGAPGVVVTLFPDRADRYFEPSRWEKEHPG
jgi:cysteine synthase B